MNEPSSAEMSSGKQEYLVRIAVSLPAEMSEDERDKWKQAELVRGRELQRQDVIRHIWRLPGRTANVGIWATESATDLDDAIASLPLYRWMTVEVTALAAHPLELDKT